MRVLIRRRWLAAVLAMLVGVVSSVVFAAPAYAVSVRDEQWYLGPLKIAQAQQISRGTGVIVAVVDTPIYAAHRDLAGQLLQGTSTGGGPSNGWGGDSMGNTHGTEVASVIVGKGGGEDHLLGIAPGAKILPVADSAGGDGDTRAIAAGVRWAADHGAKVINLSNGHTGEPLDQEIDAIRYAISKDVVVVAGVGNTAAGMRDVIAPASIPGVVAVSGLDKTGNFWTGSASGPQTVVAAPGAQMAVAVPPAEFASGYALAEGTSLSTALVSGLVALIRSKFPQLNAANVINRLIRTAKDNGDPGRDSYFGFGTFQPLAALTADVPLVSENPLGTPPGASPTATAPTGHAPAGRSSGAVHSRIAVLVGVGVLVVVVVIVAVALAVRSRRPRPTAPGTAYPAGYPPSGYPPASAAAGYPPSGPPPSGFAPPTAAGYPPGTAPPAAAGYPPGYPPTVPGQSPTTGWPGPAATPGLPSQPGPPGPPPPPATGAAEGSGQGYRG
jgi:type VII secretion-associated serine protease mycosin